jgi:hypothetical protein
VSDTQQTPTTGSAVDPFAPPGPYWGMPDDPDERWEEHRDCGASEKRPRSRSGLTRSGVSDDKTQIQRSARSGKER